MSWAVFRTTLSLLAAVFFFIVNLLVRIIKWIWDLLFVKGIIILPLILGILVTWYGAALWREHHTEVITTIDFYYCDIEEWRVIVYEAWHNNLDTIEAVQCLVNTVFATGRILVFEFLELTVFEDPGKLVPLFEGIVRLIDGTIRAVLAWVSSPFDHRFNFFLIWDGWVEFLDAIEGIFEEVCVDLFPVFQLILEILRKDELCCFFFHLVNAPLSILRELRDLALGDPDNNFERSIPSLAPLIRETCAAVLCLGDYIDNVVVDLIIIVFGDDVGIDLKIGCVLARLYCLLGEITIFISLAVTFFIEQAVDSIISGDITRPSTFGRPLIPGLGPVPPEVGQTYEILGSVLLGGFAFLSDLFEVLDWEPIIRTLYNEACRDEGGEWDPLNCDKEVASFDNDNDYDECDPDQNPLGFGFVTQNNRNFYAALPFCGPQLAECVGYTVGLIDVCFGQVIRYAIVAGAKFLVFVADLLENGNFRFGELLAQPLLDILGSSQWDDYTSYGEFTSIVYFPDGTVNDRAITTEDLLDVHIDVNSQHASGGRPFEQTGLTCLISRILVGTCGTALGDAVNGAGHILLIPVLIGQEVAWSDYSFAFGENPLDSDNRDDFNEFLLSILCIITDRLLLVADLAFHLLGCIPGLDLLEDAGVTIVAVIKAVIDTIKELFILTVELASTLLFWWIGLLFGDTSFLTGDMFTIFFELLIDWLLELFDVILDLVEGLINFLIFSFFPSIFGQNTLMDDDPGPATFTECIGSFEDCICGIAVQIFGSICLPWPIDKCISEMFGDCGCFEEDATANCRKRQVGPGWYNNGTAPDSFPEYLAIMFGDTPCGPTFEEFRDGKPDDISDVAVLKYFECVGAVRESLFFADSYPDMSYDWAMRPDLVRKTGANATKGMGVLLMSEIMNAFIFASDPDELLDRPEKNATYMDLSEELNKRGVNDTVAVNVLFSMQESLRNGTKSFFNFLNNSGTYYSDYYEQNMSLLDTAWEAGVTGLAAAEITLTKMGKANVTGKIEAGIKHGWNYWTGRLSEVPEAVRQAYETGQLRRRSPDPKQSHEKLHRMHKRMERGIFPKHITRFDIFKHNLHQVFAGFEGYFHYLFDRPPPPHNDTEHNDTDFVPQFHRPDSCNEIVEYGCQSAIGVGLTCTGPDAPIRFYENTPLCQFFFGLGAIFTCEGNESTVSFFTNTNCSDDSEIDGFPQTTTTPSCFLMTELPTSNTCGENGDEECLGYMCVLNCTACPVTQVIPGFDCAYLDNSIHRIREIVQNCLDKIGGEPLDPTLAPPFLPRAQDDIWVAPQITQRLGTDACGDGIVQPDLGEECDLGNFTSDPNKMNPEFPFGRNYPCSGCNGCFLEFCGNNFADCRPGTSPITPDDKCDAFPDPPEIWCENGTVLSGGECTNSSNSPVSGLCCPDGTYNVDDLCCQNVCSDDSEPIADRCCTDVNFPINLNRQCCENTTTPINQTCINATAPQIGLCVNSTAAVDTFSFDLGREPFGGFIEECDGNRGCSPGNVSGGQLPPPNGTLGGIASDLACIRLVCGDGRLVSGEVCPAGSGPVCFGLVFNDSPFLAPNELVELPLPFGSDASDCQPFINTTVFIRGRNITMVDPNAICVEFPQNCGVFKVFRPCSLDVLYSEECDDGNRRSNDGCDTRCRAEICPDAFFSPGNTEDESDQLRDCFIDGDNCDDLPQFKSGACDLEGEEIEGSLRRCGAQLEGDNCILHQTALRPSQCFNDPANPALLSLEIENEATGQIFQGSVQFNCRGTQKWMWIYQDEECRGNYYVDISMGDGCSTECMFNTGDESVFVRSNQKYNPFFYDEDSLPCPSHINYGLDITCADNCFTCGNNITEPDGGEQCDDGTVFPTVNPAEDSCIACQNSCSCQPGRPCMGFCFGPDYPTPKTSFVQFSDQTTPDVWGRSDGTYAVPCNAQFESDLLGEGLAGYSPCGDGNLCIPKLCCGDDTEGQQAAEDSVDEEYTFDSRAIFAYFQALEIDCRPDNLTTDWRNGTCCWTPNAFSNVSNICVRENQFTDPLDPDFDICTVHQEDSRLAGRGNPACAFQGIPWPIGLQSEEVDGEFVAPSNRNILKTKKQCDDSVDANCFGCTFGCECQPNKICIGRCIGGFWQGQKCDASNDTHCKLPNPFDIGRGDEDLSHLDGICVPEACCGDGIRQNVTSVNDNFPLIEDCGGSICVGWGGSHKSPLTTAEMIYSHLTSDLAGDDNPGKIHNDSLSDIFYYSGRFHEEQVSALTPDNCAAEEMDGRWGNRVNFTSYGEANCTVPVMNFVEFSGDCITANGFSFSCTTNFVEVAVCTAGVPGPPLVNGTLGQCIQLPSPANGTFIELNECILAENWNPLPTEVPPLPLYENATGAWVPTFCPGGFFDEGGLFGDDGYGQGCLALWPCDSCIPGRHTPDDDYNPLVNDAVCPEIRDSNNALHFSCEDPFIDARISDPIDTLVELRAFFIEGYVPLEQCVGISLPDRDNCDWFWTSERLLGTPDDSDDDLDFVGVFDYWQSRAANRGFVDVIDWTITQSTYYPCLRAFNTTAAETDDPACCPDPTCGLSVPPRPGDDGNGGIELPPLPGFGTGENRRKRQMIPAAHLLRPAGHKHGKLSMFSDTGWADDQDRFLQEEPQHQHHTAYDDYYHWLETVHPTEEQIREYHEYNSRYNVQKRELQETVEEVATVVEDQQPKSKRQLSEDGVFIVHSKVRRQDANAPIRMQAEGTPPKPDLVTPLIFDIMTWIIDLFVDNAEGALEDLQDLIFDFLTCANVDDPFDLNSEEVCIVTFIRFLIPFICDIPGNYDCHIGVGFWNTVLYVGGGLVITFVFGAWIWGSFFTMLFMLFVTFFGLTLFLAVAWGYTFWCFPITPECIPREIDETLAIFNGTCIEWPEGFVTNPANGSCLKDAEDNCLRREFTDCAEWGFLDGFDALTFMLEWLLPDLMQSFRNSMFFTFLTEFPVDQIAEYFTLMFARWDYSTEPISDLDYTCFFIVGIWFLPQVIFFLVLIGVLFWPLLEILVEALYDLWLVGVGFSLWIESIDESNEDDTIESLL